MIYRSHWTIVALFQSSSRRLRCTMLGKVSALASAELFPRFPDAGDKTVFRSTVICWKNYRVTVKH
jgi:hypothetical protein